MTVRSMPAVRFDPMAPRRAGECLPRIVRRLALTLPTCPTERLLLIEDPYQGITMIATPNDTEDHVKMSLAEHALAFLLRRGSHVLSGGSVYARAGGDTLEVWFVTNAWEDHALRLRAYDLEAQAMDRFPDVFVELHVIPPSGLPSVPADARRVL